MQRRSEILLHPVRLRIALAMSGVEMTTAALHEVLPDVPIATLYRHVAVLADEGVLRIVDEQQRRGGLERTYRLAVESASVGAEDASAMSMDDHMGGFLAFLAAITADFDRYLQHPSARPGGDFMGYRQMPLWIDEDQHADLIEELSRLVEPYLEPPPQGDARRTLLNLIVVPDIRG